MSRKASRRSFLGATSGTVAVLQAGQAMLSKLVDPASQVALIPLRLFARFSVVCDPGPFFGCSCCPNQALVSGQSDGCKPLTSGGGSKGWLTQAHKSR